MSSVGWLIVLKPNMYLSLCGKRGAPPSKQQDEDQGAIQ